MTADNDCGANVDVDFTETRIDGTCPDSYTLVRVWTASDDCGNTAKVTQNITVRDTKAPVFTFKPTDVSVECNAVPNAAVLTANDNCDANVTITFNEVKTPGQCTDSYTLTRTWIAIDNCDNATTHVQKVTVTDKTPPVLSAIPTDVTAECGEINILACQL
ncbi:MAG: hypothetical protein IPJ06_05330 [Saprospiraceae bacterium]|nr:hypothetical protein [Saprospiraceae bacterium]